MQFLDLGFIETGLRIVMAWLCSLIYPIITWLYNLFIYVSKVNILSDEIIKPIYQRVTLILTIVMVFYVTFEFVKFVVQPDGITDKEKGTGKIIYKMILVVVLIAFVPDVFTGAYKLQNIIVEKNIIGKVILGKQSETIENYGGTFSRSIFQNFYSLADDRYGNEMCDDIPCGALVGMNLTSLEQNGKMPYVTSGLGSATEIEESHEGETLEVNVAHIEFNGLFAVIVGGLIAYILVMYCIDVGVRWAQLIFLQVIAPIPIIGYLAPEKNGIFQKWVKQCAVTFLDLFIRIMIINFVLLISNILLDEEVGNHIFSNLDGIGGWMKSFVIIVLILGLLLFAQKAPKLLSELFPKMGAASGNFGLSAKDRMNVPPLVARSLGAGLGGMNRLVKGGIANARNKHKRNNEIKERRRAEGKDTSWRAVNQERRQANKDAKHAAKKYRQANRQYDQEQSKLRKENNEVLAAEKELAEAKRSGNENRIAKANDRLSKAKTQQEYRKAELRAQQNVSQAEREKKNAEQERERLIARKAPQSEIDAANARVTAAENRVSSAKKQQELIRNQSENNRLATGISNKVEQIEAKRAANAKAVQDAQKELDEAKKSGDPNAIRAAEQRLTVAQQTNDGNDVYTQNEIINNKQQELNATQSDIEKNNQQLHDAESKKISAEAALKEAQNKVTKAQEQGQTEIAAAEKALEEAKTAKDPKQIEAAEQALAQAKVSNSIAMSKANQELQLARNNQINAENAYNHQKNKTESENASLITKKNEIENVIKDATTTRDEAIRKRDLAYEAYKRSAAKHETNLQDSNIAVQTLTTEAKENRESAKAELARAQSDRANAINQSYNSAATAAISGALVGAQIGMKEGWKAEKLQDIPKQIKAGTKQNNEIIAATEKFIDAGGIGATSVIKSKIQKDLGTFTDAQLSEMQIKNYDAQIATNKRIGAIEGSVKTNVDNAKSRSGSKLEAGEQKITLRDLLPGETITYKDSSNKKFALKLTDEDRNKTTSEIYEAEKNNTKMAREKAQAAQQAYANAKAQGNVSEDRLQQLEKEANEASAHATREEQLLGQKKKALEEFAITSVLRTAPNLRRNANIQPDQVLVEQVENSLQSIEESKRNADTYNKTMALLQSQDPKYATAYSTGIIKDFDTLDKIQAALSTVKAQRDRDTATLETIAGINKSSSQYDAQKAADEASGKL